MTRLLRRLLVEFGALTALLSLCAVLSVLTFKEQPAMDDAAAHQLGKRLASELQPQSRVLIAGRDIQADQRFGDVVEQELQAAQMNTIRVQGTPLDARRALEQLRAESQPLAAVVGNSITAQWLIFQQLPVDFPQLGACRLVKPVPYRWPTFLKADNLLNIGNQIAVIAIIAVGMTLVIIAGGIDLSVGSQIAFSSVVAGVLIRQWGGEQAGGTAMIVASALGILACGLVGAFSGIMVVALEIPPFIVTLATMLSASGCAFLLADGHSIPEIPLRYTWLGQGATWLGIPNAVVLMAATYLIAHFVLTRTVLGRYIYAVGGNREAARLSGIPHRGVILFTFVVSGLLAGTGGIVYASQFHSGDPRYGIMYELYVIAAVVVGGTSLSGGTGTITGTLIGALLIAVINNGMNLLDINPHAQKIILGGVILGAVVLDRVKRQFR